jgi:hypothetical protein
MFAMRIVELPVGYIAQIREREPRALPVTFGINGNQASNSFAFRLLGILILT